MRNEEWWWRLRRKYMGRCPKMEFKSLVTTSYLFPFKNSVIRSNSSSFLKVMEIVPL